MFFKSFLNKTEIQCLFPGVWEQRPGPKCALRKLRGGKGASGYSAVASCISAITCAIPQVPQEYGRVTVTRLLWRQGTRGHDLEHLGSSALAKGKPELDSIRIQPGGPASGPGSSGSGRLPQGRAGKGLGDDLV